MFKKFLLMFCLAVLSSMAMAEFKADDFKIDLTHADRCAGQSVLYSPETLKNTARFYLNDPAGRKGMDNIKAASAQLLNDGDFKSTGPYNDYIFRISLMNPGMLYFLTGHKKLGKFIHDKTMELVNRPLEFWLHAERFPMAKNNPIATLQTGDMLSRVIPGIDLCAELFSESEKQQIREAIRKKGLRPCQLFMQGKSKNNWLAVIAGGGYMAAKYCGDTTAEKEISTVIKRYLEEAFEKDGSYGEGQQYLLYPVGRLIPAASTMTPEQLFELFGSTPLAKSGEYLPYSFFFFDFDNSLVRIQFRDGQQIASFDSLATYSIALICRSGTMLDFCQRMNVPPPLSVNPNYVLLSRQLGQLTVPVSLDTLPKVRAFDNGECYIRSNWTANGIVFGMLSGGENKTGFSHDRPARNGIALGAYGEYLLVTPGHSSYRGDTYLNHDATTHGNNAVSIDGKNQLFPHKAGKFASFGVPKAEVLVAKSEKDYDVIISDAAGCYAEKPEFTLRAAVFVRTPGYMVIFDRIGGIMGGHQFDSYWHFNNLDGKAVLKNIGPDAWKLERPKANMSIFVRSDSALKSELKPGIMHRSYEYTPGGPGEGKPGSAKVLQLSSPAGANEWHVATVLFPENSAADASAVKITGNGRKLEVIIGTHHATIEFTANKTISLEVKK